VKRSECGFVLVSVLWIRAILTVIAVGFQRRAMMDARAAMFTLDHSKAMFMARGAVARGIVEIRNKAVIDALYKQGGRTSFGQRWANTMDMLQEKAYFSDEGEDAKDDLCRYIIRDEESLVSVNAADENTLNKLEGLDLSVVRKVMRRRTGNRDENEVPQPFQTVEEIREMEGVSDKDWFGTDKKVGLRDLLTCWGTGQINVNTASAAVLKCIPELRDNVVNAIVAYRQGPDGELGTEDDQDFANVQEIAEKTGISGESLAPIQRYCKVDSQFFTIRGIATRRQGKVVATCVATVMVEGASALVIKWREEFVDS
jgi:type II secretory pathway component PulK